MLVGKRELSGKVAFVGHTEFAGGQPAHCAFPTLAVVFPPPPPPAYTKGGEKSKREEKKEEKDEDAFSVFLADSNIH